jgi:hypothetical protein
MLYQASLRDKLPRYLSPQHQLIVEACNHCINRYHVNATNHSDFIGVDNSLTIYTREYQLLLAMGVKKESLLPKRNPFQHLFLLCNQTITHKIFKPTICLFKPIKNSLRKVTSNHLNTKQKKKKKIVILTKVSLANNQFDTRLFYKMPQKFFF